MAFSGTITIANTGEYNYDEPCPLGDVRVCLLHNNPNTKTEIACSNSDAQGRYQIPALIGLNVELSFDYLNHTFSRTVGGSNPSYFDSSTHTPVYTVSDTVLWNQVDFEDSSTATLEVQVAGGECGRVLGESVIHLILPLCPGADPAAPGEPYTREVVISNALSGTFELPAHDVEVKLEEVVGRPIVATYLAQVNERIQIAELDQLEPDLVRFEFHPPPTVAVRFNGASSSGCANAPTILMANTPTTAVFTITQEFASTPSVVAACDIFLQGNLTVINAAATEEPTDDELDCSGQGCTVPITHSVAGTGVLFGATAELTFTAGEPESNPLLLSEAYPYTRSFKVIAISPGWDPVVVEVPLLLQGTLARSAARC